MSRTIHSNSCAVRLASHPRRGIRLNRVAMNFDFMFNIGEFMHAVFQDGFQPFVRAFCTSVWRLTAARIECDCGSRAYVRLRTSCPDWRLSCAPDRADLYIFHFSTADYSRGRGVNSISAPQLLWCEILNYFSFVLFSSGYSLCRQPIDLNIFGRRGSKPILVFPRTRPRLRKIVLDLELRLEWQGTSSARTLVV